MKRKWLPMSADSLKQQAELRLSDSREEILPGIWATGEIRDRSEPEGRSPHHFVRDGDEWQADPYRDDMSLVLTTPNGPFVLCGCCHAGLLNTLAQVRSQFGTNPVGVAGGTHLVGAGPDRLADTVDKLRDLGSPALHLNHCTGTPALVALSRVFGDRVSHLPAGTTLEIESCV